MQAGLIFSGDLHADIRFASGPFRRPYARLQDYLDVKALRLGDAAPAIQQP